jgi:hypothetical protein
VGSSDVQLINSLRGQPGDGAVQGASPAIAALRGGRTSGGRRGAGRGVGPAEGRAARHRHLDEISGIFRNSTLADLGFKQIFRASGSGSSPPAFLRRSCRFSFPQSKKP